MEWCSIRQPIMILSQLAIYSWSAVQLSRQYIGSTASAPESPVGSSNTQHSVSCCSVPAVGLPACMPAARSDSQCHLFLFWYRSPRIWYGMRWLKESGGRLFAPFVSYRDNTETAVLVVKDTLDFAWSFFLLFLRFSLSWVTLLPPDQYIPHFDTSSGLAFPLFAWSTPVPVEISRRVRQLRKIQFRCRCCHRCRGTRNAGKSSHRQA